MLVGSLLSPVELELHEQKDKKQLPAMHRSTESHADQCTVKTE